MAFNSNGQISYLVLDSLSHGSKYGLEIIEYITKKTNGGFVMKKPTLYSCLTRMEKKGLVSSSFWGESELGGKRHYYTITDEGKRSLTELAPAFENAKITENTQETNIDEFVEETQTEESANESPTFLQQSNFFDLVKPEQKKQQVEEGDDEESPLENQINFFDLPQQNTEKEQEIQGDGVFLDEQTTINEENSAEDEEAHQEKIDYYQSILESTPKKDDAVFLDVDEKAETPAASREAIEQQNKRVFDSASEFNKYRKRKSFSENQIEMSVVYENENDDEIQKERIAELKRSLLNMKNGYETEESHLPVDTQTESYVNNEKPTEQILQPYQNHIVDADATTSENNNQECEQDDGVFITARMSASEVPVQRKIAPPNIDVFNDNLPAPKRNSELEPTYKDMMSKIFERKKEKVEQQKQARQETYTQNEYQPTINDYNSLKRYYNANGIDFKEYNKSPVQKTYNTNFLRFINSIILFALSGISSAILFWIISSTKHLNNSTNFMFYTIPILFFCYAVFTFARYKVSESKKASLTYTAIVNWIVFWLATIIVLIINVICGMNFETIGNFLTSLILPIISFAIIFPINHYTTKYIYERFSK